MAGWLETRERVLAQYDRFTATYEETTSRATAERLRHRSPDGLITVIVDGGGTVRSITITPGTLRGAHPGRLAASVTNAVNEASRAATARLSRQFRENLEEGR